MSKNEINHSKAYSKLIGYINLNTKITTLKKQEILKKLNDNIKVYDYYIQNFLHFDDNKLGIEKIIDTIREKYFN